MNPLGKNKKPGDSMLLTTAWAGLRKQDNDLTENSKYGRSWPVSR